MSDEKKTDKKEKGRKKIDNNSVIETEPKLDISKDEDVQEATLDRMARLRRAITMRKHKAKIARGRRIASKRAADPKKIQKRARRKAINLVRKKITGKKDYKSMSASEKMVVDKRVSARKRIIDRNARRLVPKVRKADQARRAGIRRAIDEDFEKLIKTKDYKPSPAPKKRFHQLMTKDGKVKHDRRFRFNKKPVEESRQLSELSVDKIRSIKVNVPGVPDDIMKKINSHFDRPFERRAIAHLWKLANSKGNRHSLGHYALQISKTFDDLTPRQLTGLYKQVFEETSIDAEFSSLVEKNAVKVSQSQLKALEKLADRFLEKFDVDIEFTKHFGERMVDERNNPVITIEELAATLKKIINNKAQKIKKYKDAEAVIKDIQADLNIPVVVDFDDKNREFDVRFKTIMRKKKFFTRDPIIKYEQKEY